MHAQTHLVSRQKGSRIFMPLLKYFYFFLILKRKNCHTNKIKVILRAKNLISGQTPSKSVSICVNVDSTKRSNKRQLQSIVPFGLLLILPPNGKQVQ